MNPAALARDAAAAVMRSLPAFRGAVRLCKAVNALTLACGAPALAEARMRDGTSLIVDLTTATEMPAFYTGHYDRQLMETLCALVDPDACFVDVGANIGFYTVAMASRLRASNGRGLVLAFEPLPANFRRLQQNVRRNGLEGQCLLQQLGLSDRAGTAEITLREDFARGSGTGNAAIATSAAFDGDFRRVPVALDRFDTVVDAGHCNGRRIDVIKLDIEGHEDFFLRGAEATLAAHRPTLLLEVNKPYYRARGVAADAVLSAGIPERYARFRRAEGEWARFSSFEECAELDDALLIPEEKLERADYDRFRAQVPAAASRHSNDSTAMP